MDNAYAIAISSIACETKPDSFMYSLLHKSFTNRYVSLLDLSLSIAAGLSYGAWSDEGKFVQSSVISIDLEGGPQAAMDDAVQVEFMQQFGALAYTTMSHTLTNPRCRMVFLLEAPIENEDDYRDTAAAVATMWDKRVVDPQTSQPMRRFLGNPNDNARTILLGNTLPMDIAEALRDALRIQLKLRQRAPTPSLAPGNDREFKNAPAFLMTALEELASTPAGGRNAKLCKVAFMFGKFAVGPGFMSQVLAESIVNTAGQQAGLSAQECDEVCARSVRDGANLVRATQQV